MYAYGLYDLKSVSAIDQVQCLAGEVSAVGLAARYGRVERMKTMERPALATRRQLL